MLPVTKCDGCATPVGEREFFGPHCIVCLAEDFGAEHLQRTIADALRRLFVSLLFLDDPDAPLAAVQALVDALDEASSTLGRRGEERP